jgi:hypothetical protein
VVKNDYDDFLGTGVPLKSEDHLRGFLGRYLYRVKDDWFVGVQAVATNYQIVGQSALDDDMLAILGLTGFEAGGIGWFCITTHGTSTTRPSAAGCSTSTASLIGKRIEGSNNFDVYRADYRHFWSHGEGHVFALRQKQSVDGGRTRERLCARALRGYTDGEYLGKKHVLHRGRGAVSLR